MLNDEEKEAVEYWKTHMEILHWNTQLASEHYIKVLLDLVEKQSKDIEELKAISEYREKIIKGLGLKTLPKTITGFRKLIENNDKKWEDKIKAKIEEYEKEKELYDKDADREWGQYNNWDWIDSFINELQSLLEKE